MRLGAAIALVFVAVAIVAVEVRIGMTAARSPDLLLTLALITTATILWTIVGLFTLLGRRKPVEPPEVTAVADDPVAARFDRVDAQLRILMVEADLAEARQAVARTSQAVETWDDVVSDAPRFAGAACQLTAILRTIMPTLSPPSGEPSADELRAGREKLPATRNFSSEELRAALRYIVERDRVAIAYDAFRDYRAGLIEQAAPPSAPD